MTLTMNLLVIVALLTIHRVCKRQKLSPPPLRLPLIAAIGIPLLNQLAAIVSDAGATLLQNSLEAAITLLWALSLIRILTWGILQIPAELGWWKPTAKILRDLLTLAVITAVVMVVIHREFRVNLVGLAATSAVVTAVIATVAGVISVRFIKDCPRARVKLHPVASSYSNPTVPHTWFLKGVHPFFLFFDLFPF